MNHQKYTNGDTSRVSPLRRNMKLESRVDNAECAGRKPKYTELVPSINCGQPS
jgi:hypothetical protein